MLSRVSELLDNVLMSSQMAVSSFQLSFEVGQVVPNHKNLSRKLSLIAIFCLHVKYVGQTGAKHTASCPV